MSEVDLKRMIRKGRVLADAVKLDRLPPHSPEAEQGVLGCVMLSPNDCMGVCIERLKEGAEVFYDLRHQTIFSTLAEMYDGREAIDIITLQQRLKNKQLLEEVGGIAYLTALPDTVPSSANLSYYLDIVLEKHVLRKMIHTCTDVVGRVYEFEGDVAVLLDTAERDILAIRQFRSRTETQTVNEAVKDALSRMEKALDNKGGLDGMSTGFVDLDRMTGGLHGGELNIIGGFTSTGKTSLAMNIAEHIAIDQGLPVGIFSLEMSAASLATRAICSRARVDLKKARTGQFTEGDFGPLTTAATAISKACIIIDDKRGPTIATLKAKARRMKQSSGIRLLVVDYLQKVDGSSGKREETDEKQLNRISTELANIAGELDVAVIALCQLNKDGKTRGSQAIAMDADNIFSIRSADSKKGDGEFQHIGDDVVAVDLVIEKQRNGPTGKVPLTFLKKFVRFENAARRQDDGID